jgi:hypothetical protein
LDPQRRAPMTSITWSTAGSDDQSIYEAAALSIF